MKSIPTLKSLLFELQKLPGIGPRSAQRLAQHLLRTPENDIKTLSKSLIDLKNNIKKCVECFNFTEGDPVCSICNDPHRDSKSLCVVEQAFDVFRIENCGSFKGKYHVLHGSISPLNHVHPKNLTLLELANRIKKGVVEELILAIDSDLEGDTTALYIAKMVDGSSLKISRLASGIPFGSDLEYVDDKTLSQAIENRSYF
ncbi:MAG: recombination mediator RecR [Bdellovibrionales bacterium]